MSTIESKIRELNREILRLKTAHPVASSLRTFYGIYTFVEGARTGTDVYEITFVDGANTIMTWNGWTWGVDQGGLTFGEVMNNKQRFYDIEPFHGSDDEYTIFSTRQILSVTYIGNIPD